MSASKALYFAPKVFAAGELASGYRRVVSQVFGDKHGFQVAIFRKFADGTSKSSQKPIDVLARTCDLHSEKVRLVLDFGQVIKLGFSTLARVEMNPDFEGFLEVTFRAQTVEILSAMLRAVENELQLTSASDRERTSRRPRRGIEGIKRRLQKA
jgi:hypothetical protein